MGNEVGSYIGLNEIGNPSPMMIFIIISYLFNHNFWPKAKSISIKVFYWCHINSTLCYCFWGRLYIILKTQELRLFILSLSFNFIIFVTELYHASKILSSIKALQFFLALYGIL